MDTHLAYRKSSLASEMADIGDTALDNVKDLRKEIVKLSFVLAKINTETATASVDNI